MKIVDFIRVILRTHAALLKQLKDEVGESRLLQALEAYYNRDLTYPWIELKDHASQTNGPDFAFAKLAESVSALNLSPDLEDYLWSYPQYRAYMESDINLSDHLDDSSEKIQLAIRESREAAAQWIQNIELPPSADSASEAFLTGFESRFRSELLRTLGKSPLSKIK